MTRYSIAAIAVAAAALTACSSKSVWHDWNRDEVPATTYADIASSYEREAVSCQRLVRRAMADGKVDYGELREINRCDEDQSNQENAGAKVALRAKLAASS